MTSQNTNTCFHCGLEISPNNLFYVVIENENRPMCCAGCQAVAQTIMDSGLGDYYRHRTESATTATDNLTDILQQIIIYDDPQLQKSFVSNLGENVREAALILEGVTCPACIWMNEQHLKKLPGIIDVQVNFTTHRLQIKWDDHQLKLSDILKTIYEIGYKAHPYDPDQNQQILEKERKRLLRRLGIAGVLGMQVMMLAIGLYVGEWSSIETQYKQFLHWISLGLTLPVVVYSARAFFEPAYRDLKQKKLGMDVPISLGVLFAFLGSVKTTIAGTGEVYFDSVVMFVFFLLVARYLELIARKRASETSENLIRLLPATAIRIIETENNTEQEIIAIHHLKTDDIVLVKPGDTIPADGHLLSGKTSINEALLTGESLPVYKQQGDKVIGGSINIESPITFTVKHTGTDTVLSQITHLFERAQLEKPAITQLANKAASWFVPIVLIIAALMAGYHWWAGHSNWFEITLSLLVVTCPCALSLATPTAVTVATGTLMKQGVLSTRGHSIETLAQVDHFVFDKTGTLTQGDLTLLETKLLADIDQTECLKIAAALEQGSEHPVAKAILAAYEVDQSIIALNIINIPGAGLTGNINGQNYTLGTAKHIEKQTGIKVSASSLSATENNSSLVYLANNGTLLCQFVFTDTLRPEAKSLIKQLLDEGKEVSLLSGDSEPSVQYIARELGIKNYQAQLTPDEKLSSLKILQKNGKTVAMTGDGINDAPVLAAAQLSIAMGSGTELAKANADIVLLAENLNVFTKAVSLAEKTVTIIKQNLLWAVLYNVFALPIAAMGFLAPWMAAVGMSLSSLIVISNALRLRKL